MLKPYKTALHSRTVISKVGSSSSDIHHFVKIVSAAVSNAVRTPRITCHCLHATVCVNLNPVENYGLNIVVYASVKSK